GAAARRGRAVDQGLHRPVHRRRALSGAVHEPVAGVRRRHGAGFVDVGAGPVAGPPGGGTGVTFLARLACPRCGREYDARVPTNLCACGSPLLAHYDLAAVGRAVSPGAFAGREASLWRYRELLPVADPAHVTALGDGWT